MGLEKVKDLIIDSAKKKADEMIEAEKNELEKEFENFKKKLEEEYILKIEKFKKEIEEEIARTKAIEVAKIEKEKLLLKKKILDEFFRQLKATILSDENTYKNLLFSLERKDAVNGSTIFLNENDLKKFKKDVEKIITHELKLKDVKVSDVPISISGGLVIKTENFEIDDSLDSLIESFREEKEIEIAKEIFG
ncbi:ATP synthase subunit B family protein [Caldisericum exile]|uniref:V-type proton ATPase subunit E n=1 Tax=Caldisericum exile (strain DSM 21853 / NBRC 104410 / AZM16c01) TaxID=511051 RepID=A0A7U6GF67_CALEA|nr:V-type proton ATPase subunit E [Caldisericum exile]BAL81287.1 V-type proton ATPase subunit E [Caldisericum exile AZM16c01]